MKSLVDIRCYITPEYKHQIKRTALDRNISVNKLLGEIVRKAIPQLQDSKQEGSTGQELTNFYERRLQDEG